MSKLDIVHLYPDELNVYGDDGNVHALMARCHAYGLEVDLAKVKAGDPWPKNIDIVLAGGGQDRHQIVVQKDLLERSAQIKDSVEQMVPMLLICGSYQLFGNSFIDGVGSQVPGIGIFDMETIAVSDDRISGNCVISTDEFGTLYGYENHGGRTRLSGDTKALGTVIKGTGNNDDSNNIGEGARYNNAIGTYLHGPLIPRSPVLADWLIETALSNKSVQIPEKTARVRELDQWAEQVNESLKARLIGK